jgi:hypothetical protein
MKSRSLVARIAASGLLVAGACVAQTAPLAGDLQNITGCSLDGADVFITTGEGADARRYKYAWDASIDALCNAKGFAIASPSRPAAKEGAKQAVVATGAAAPAFPADAAPVASTALREVLAGKTYVAKTADGSNWRWQFKADGYFFFNAGGYSDSGKWSTKESAICSEPRKTPASCNEVRQLGNDLLLKRDSGEVIRLSAQ